MIDQDDELIPFRFRPDHKEDRNMQAPANTSLEVVRQIVTTALLQQDTASYLDRRDLRPDALLVAKEILSSLGISWDELALGQSSPVE